MADRRITGYAANYIPGLQQVFGSANEALRFLKETGVGVRRQNFLWEWGAQLHETEQQPQHFTAALEQLPTERSISRRRAPEARGYHYVVQHLVQEPDSGELYWTFGGYRGQRLVSYGEALAGAEQAFLEGQLQDARYPQGSLVGSRVQAVREYLPELADEEAA